MKRDAKGLVKPERPNARSFRSANRSRHSGSGDVPDADEAVDVALPNFQRPGLSGLKVTPRPGAGILCRLGVS
jgi:hypothetical protein